jgi:acyl carrier protein
MVPAVTPSIDVFRSAYRRVTADDRDVTAEENLRDDLGLDSIAAMEVVTLLESDLGVPLVDDEELSAACTVTDVCRVIDRVRQNAGSTG